MNYTTTKSKEVLGTVGGAVAGVSGVSFIENDDKINVFCSQFITDSNHYWLRKMMKHRNRSNNSKIIETCKRNRRRIRRIIQK